MTDIRPTFFEKDGVELVILTRVEFESLIAAAADAEEDASDVALYDARKADLRRDPRAILPVEVGASMMKGDSLLKALRKWRGMTQMDVSHRAGIGQGYLSDMEAGRKAGTPDTLAKLAAALDVAPSWIPQAKVAETDEAV